MKLYRPFTNEQMRYPPWPAAPAKGAGGYHNGAKVESPIKQLDRLLGQRRECDRFEGYRDPERGEPGSLEPDEL